MHALFELPSFHSGARHLVSAVASVQEKAKLTFRIKTHRELGYDVVARCLNVLLEAGPISEPRFLGNLSFGADNPKIAAAIRSGIDAACEEVACEVLAPLISIINRLYSENEYRVAGCGVASVHHTVPKNFSAGDRLIGLHTSSLQVDGYSLVRKILAQSSADLDAVLSDGQLTLGRALVEPGRLFVGPVGEVLEAGLATAAYYVGKGGVEGALARIGSSALSCRVGPASWPTPAIFDWLQHQGSLSDLEMRSTFNCGLGMLLVIPASACANAIERLCARGVAAYDIGTLESATRDIPSH